MTHWKFPTEFRWVFQ